MVEFKVVISNTKDGKSYQKPITGQYANALIGKKIGDKVDGIFLGLPGYKLVITGGSDGDGVPMRKDLPGPRRKKVLVSESIGFHPKDKGVRRRKNMRGNTVSAEITQLNFAVTQASGQSLDKLLAKEEENKE